MALSVTVSEPDKRIFSLDLRELWLYRELLYFLIWRDVKIRYKQTIIGAAWAVLQPLTTMVIFTVIFGNFAKIPSDDLPYPIFAYTALLPWTFFSQAIGRNGVSLVNNAHLITKIYFPRIMIPLAATVVPAVDFAFSFLILVGMMFWYGIGLTWWIATLPLFMAFAFVTALAVGLWVAPLNVWYRDLGFTLPFITQIWMYASPIVYPVSVVPEQWRFLYSLNPIVGVVEGFRWALLGKAAPDLQAVGISALIISALLIGGILCFKRMETTFADII